MEGAVSARTFFLHFSLEPFNQRVGGVIRRMWVLSSKPLDRENVLEKPSMFLGYNCF